MPRPSPNFRFLLLDLPHGYAFGWRRPCTNPRLSLLCLTGDELHVHLEADEPGIRAFIPDAAIPRDVIAALAVETHIYLHREICPFFVRDNPDWFQVFHRPGSNQIALSVFAGTPRQFTRRFSFRRDLHLLIPRGATPDLVHVEKGTLIVEVQGYEHRVSLADLVWRDPQENARPPLITFP